MNSRQYNHLITYSTILHIPNTYYSYSSSYTLHSIHILFTPFTYTNTNRNFHHQSITSTYSINTTPTFNNTSTHHTTTFRNNHLLTTPHQFYFTHITINHFTQHNTLSNSYISIHNHSSINTLSTTSHTTHTLHTTHMTNNNNTNWYT